jgi:hypothetical protein
MAKKELPEIRFQQGNEMPEMVRSWGVEKAIPLSETWADGQTFTTYQWADKWALAIDIPGETDDDTRWFLSGQGMCPSSPKQWRIVVERTFRDPEKMKEDFEKHQRKFH